MINAVRSGCKLIRPLLFSYFWQMGVHILQQIINTYQQKRTIMSKSIAALSFNEKIKNVFQFFFKDRLQIQNMALFKVFFIQFQSYGDLKYKIRHQNRIVSIHMVMFNLK